MPAAVSTRGKRLFYRTAGSGEPVILLPGSSQSHVAFTDSGLAEALAGHFEVCLMDVTGLGDSERVTSAEPQDWASDVLSVMDAAGWPSAHVLGSSLGGRIAARVAADHPGRVRTLLIDMPITGVSDAEEERISAMFADYRNSPLAEGWKRWHGERWEEAMDFFVAFRARRDFREYFSPRFHLDRIAAPTLICRSDEENAAHPLAQALEWHARAQDSQLWIEPGAGNAALTMVCADEVARRFARFVDRRSGGSV